MKYTMKSGVLYKEQSLQALAKIKGTLMGPLKKIYRSGEEPVLRADIRYPDARKEYNRDMQYREYVLVNDENEIAAAAHPGYAEGDDPAVTGWPICRMPKVDHAQVAIEAGSYLLTMHNSQNYSMRDSKGCEMLHIMHIGISGGWSMNQSKAVNL